LLYILFHQIFGEKLIESIERVGGDGATEEILTAWTEAFDYLSKTLIATEKELYAKK